MFSGFQLRSVRVVVAFPGTRKRRASVRVVTQRPSSGKLVNVSPRSPVRRAGLGAAQRYAETYEGVLPLMEQLVRGEEVSFPLVDNEMG